MMVLKNDMAILKGALEMLSSRILFLESKLPEALIGKS